MQNKYEPILSVEQETIVKTLICSSVLSESDINIPARRRTDLVS